MKKQNLYYYPPGDRAGFYSNPYSANYKLSLLKYFNVFEEDNKKRIGLRSLHLLIYSFLADVFILNWIEKIGAARYGCIQQFLTKLSIRIMRLRNKQVVWMFHNIHPHKGEQRRTKEMQSFLFSNATLIISHSNYGAEYARKKTSCLVEYICHPVSDTKSLDVSEKVSPFPCDVFIWGTILPYKGIAEFLEQEIIKDSNLRIHIIGFCNDKELDNRIRKNCSSNVSYVNRAASESEIAAFCKASRYVLFPYVGDSVSSSGALIDTIRFCGQPIGPRLGAFKDLEQMGVCLTYGNSQELYEILRENRRIDENARLNFLKDNTWDEFADKVYKLLNNE